MATSKPNLILITTDQQRFDTIHRAGNPHILTPHLNWLADTGVLMRRAYTDAPICCAARATMITGKHYRNLGGCGNWGQPSAPDVAQTLPAILTRQGYQTRSVGKVHYDPPRCNYGYEHMEILEDYYRFMRQFPDRGIPMDHGVGQNEMEPVISTIEEPWSLTRWIVNRAIDFVETRDTTRPFFLNVGFSKPHPPYDPCMNYWQLYAGMQMPAPVFGEWSRDPASIPPGFMSPTWSLNKIDRFGPDMVQQVRRAYYACITQIDYNLGNLFSRLRELNILDNTLIVFSADHGDMLGDHHMGAKTVFLEGSAHIPMLVRGPDSLVPPQLRGTQSDALVCLADIMPTLLNVAGVSPNTRPHMDGIDLLEVIGGRAKSRESFVGAYGDQFCTISHGHKYLFCSSGGGELLFNMRADPLETNDLSRQAGSRDIRNRLRHELAQAVHASGNPAASETDMKVLAEEPAREQVGHWPGFHSRDHTPSDVLH